MSYITLSMNPAQPGSNVSREIERLLQDVVPVRTTAGWTPAVNAIEDPKGFTMEFDVPGFAPGQLEVTAQDGALVVRGTRPMPEANKESRVMVTERPEGSFERRLRLPKTADISRVFASHAHGVLTVRVEKLATVSPRKVTINVADRVADRTVNAAELPVAGK